MQIKTITVKKIKNLGNYQNETFEAVAELSEGENPVDAAQDLRKFVHVELLRKLPDITEEDF